MFMLIHVQGGGPRIALSLYNSTSVIYGSPPCTQTACFLYCLLDYCSDGNVIITANDGLK